MLNFTKFFMQGLKKTLRLQSGVNFSYKGPWVQLYPGTIMDEWYYGDFCAVEYTIVADLGGQDKEIIKCLVIADVDKANITEYGRTNLGRDLVDITAQVNSSKVSIIINPALSEDSTASIGAKVIYSASYYHSLNDIGQSTTVSYQAPAPVEAVASYAVTPAENNVNEGSSVVFNVTTTNVANGTPLYWSVTNAGDFSTSTGSFTVTNNAGTFSVTPTADVTTEGVETFTASVRTDSVSGTVVATSSAVTINDTSLSPIVQTYAATPVADNIDEGSALTINVATANIANGTTLYWTVSTPDEFDIVNGSFTVTNNAGTFSVTPGADALTEGVETFTASVRTGSVSGTIVATTGNITINDTSITPSGIIYNVTVANGSNIYGTGNKYYISGFDAVSPSLNLIEGQTYVFRQSNSSNDTHQLRFSTTPDGTWGGGVEYTSGVTLVGTAGSLGAYSQITVGNNTPTLYYYCVNHSGMGGTANTPAASTPTYDSISSVANANEGDVVTFTLTTQNIDNGTTVDYTITGINAGDISAGLLSGTLTVNNNAATTSITLANDLTTEGSETMTLTLAAIDSAANSTGALTTQTIIADTSTEAAETYAATPAANSINEGTALAVSVATTNVPDATTLYWTATNSGDFNVSSGSFVITSNVGAFSVTPTSDELTEGAETFQIQIRTESVSGTIVETTNNITINDTSLTPIDPPTYAATPAANSINEGSSLTINIATTNVPDATTLYWTATSASDFTNSSGSVTITNNSGSFNVSPIADATTEGVETFTISIRTDSIGGTIVATTDNITINDTSISPAFIADYTITVTNSGNNYLLTGNDRNGGFTNSSQPTLAYNNGDLVQFIIDAGTSAVHPFYIKTAQGAGTDNQASGVDGQGTTEVNWTIGSTGTFYYQCSIHAAMNNTITVS
jgi:hypothetical protein